MVYSGKSDVKVLILVPRSLYPPLPLPGYKTHQVGKWNAGSLLYGQVPTERGFDSSLGYMSGEEDHYTQVGGYGSVAANYMPAELLVGPGYSHNDEDRAGNRSGSSSRSNGDLKGDLVDLLENGVPALGKNGNYAAYMYTNRTVDIIEAHDPSTPLFVYHAWQEAHVPNEVPAEFEDPSIDFPLRRVYEGPCVHTCGLWIVCACGGWYECTCVLHTPARALSHARTHAHTLSWV